VPQAPFRKHVCRSLRRLCLRAKHGLPQALRVLSICPSRIRGRFRLSAVRPAMARSRQFAPEKVRGSIEHPTSSIESASFIGFKSVSRGAWLLLSVSTYRFSSSVARAACASSVGMPSPSKFKAWLRLHERGLTLPSSGPAFGGPLKSNVRPRKNLIMRASLLFVVPIALSARRYLPQAQRHRGVPPRSHGSLRPHRSRGCPAFAECAWWRWLEANKEGTLLAPLPPGHKAKIQVGLAQSRPSSSDPRIHGPQPWRSGFFSQYPSTASVQASLVRLVLQRW